MKKTGGPEYKPANKLELGKLSFTSKVTSYVFERRSPTIAICLIGILAVAYGTVKDSDVIFTIGIMCVIAGYLLIRRKIKELIRNKE